MRPETYQGILDKIRATPDTPPENIAECGVCHFRWDDTISTELTPTPSARCPNEGNHPNENYGDPADDDAKIPDDKVRIAVYSYGAHTVLFGAYGFTMTFPNMTAAASWANSCNIKDEVSILNYRHRQKFSEPVRVLYGP